MRTLPEPSSAASLNRLISLPTMLNIKRKYQKTRLLEIDTGAPQSSDSKTPPHSGKNPPECDRKKITPLDLNF